MTGLERQQDPCPTPGQAVSDSPRLAFARIGDIARLPEGERWLVEGFLSGASITVLASAPKTGKTWVAMALAVGVASGAPALGRFHVPSLGPVLIYPAEDDPRAIRERIESICLGQRLSFEGLPIHVITAESLRLDQPAHREELEELLAHLRPRLLILDPLVRLHSGVESYVGHMAELFRYLRALQRRFQLAILVTHHLAKNRAAGAQPGQSMRGSGDIHAAYDHGATLQRREDGSVLVALEHRSAPSPEPFAFRLLSRPGGATSFEILDDLTEDFVPSSPSPHEGVPPMPQELALPGRVLTLIRRSAEPVTQVSLRKALQVRNATLTAALRELEAAGSIENLGRMKGWRPKTDTSPTAAPS